MPRLCLSSALTVPAPPDNRLKGKEALPRPGPDGGSRKETGRGRGGIWALSLSEFQNNLLEMLILVSAEVQGFRVSRGYFFSAHKRDFCEYLLHGKP